VVDTSSSGRIRALSGFLRFSGVLVWGVALPNDTGPIEPCCKLSREAQETG